MFGTLADNLSNHVLLWLWIPGLRLTAHPGMTTIEGK
jgi:hypothetical protein